MPRRTSRLSPDRNRMLVTTFRSLATTPAFAESISRSKFLACHFASQPAGYSARSAFSSTTKTGSPRFRPLRRFKPVAVLPANLVGRASYLRFPSGLLHPSGSKRSARFAVNRSAFRIRPISSRSPRLVSIASVSAADHRSWSATFPLMSELFPGTTSLPLQSNKLGQVTSFVTSDWLSPVLCIHGEA
jgi:hypothetical protein